MERFDMRELQRLSISELNATAKQLGLVEYSSLPKQELIAGILEAVTKSGGTLFGGGVLDVLPEKYGFLRSPNHNYLPSKNDIYVSSSQINRFGLCAGHEVQGEIRPPKKNGAKKEDSFALLKIESVNGESPRDVKQKIDFNELTVVYSHELFQLEHDQHELSTRIIDLMVPIGKGQRGLIIGAPYGGKTSLLSNIAHGLVTNHPEVMLLVLLIDERPEEVTDIMRSISGEVISSSFDESPQQHVQIAEIVIEKAKRWVEFGKDVVILLDSLTRLARAYNVVTPSSGRTLSGGMDALSFVKPRQFCGAARKVEDGGSLTILATVLVDTESRADQYIYEEFKGTANLEIHLHRGLLDQRIFPPIDINPSKTRRDELLLKPDVHGKVSILRKFLSRMSSTDSLELLIEYLAKTETNAQFLEMMSELDASRGLPRTSKQIVR